ncbi:hypothetical protein I4U23_017561 [Adineta vaga]|nr:hypothetical protein I4U23_017561 [Adineta vaga]
MDLDPMISNIQDDYSYSDYDNRPIRPMNQEALNETLARLPILIDEDDYNNRTNGSPESNTSIKARLTNRRQPILAHSTRRKILPATASSVTTTTTNTTNNNQSLLHVNTTIGTPKSNKRKLGGCTPAITPSANKVIKQLDCRQELNQLKEENKLLEEAKANLQIECILLKNTHETELENVKQDHQQAIETLVQEHKVQREQFDTTLADKEQALSKINLELDNLRNDHSLLLLEKETLEKIVAEYQMYKEEMTKKMNDSELTIQNLREEVEKFMKIQEQQKQKQSTMKSTLANGRVLLKGTSTDRPRTAGSTAPTNTKTESIRPKANVKGSSTRGTKKDELITTPSSASINTSLNKSNSSSCSSAPIMKPPLPKSKTKTSVIIDEKKKSICSMPSIDKRTSLISTRTRSKIVPAKS